jgi:regulator of cell morphogenesis and NO signaling
MRPGDCPAHRAFYGGVKEFQRNLRQHIHLEGNILFPRAILLQSSAMGAAK